jgi:hypothetical protein
MSATLLGVVFLAGLAGYWGVSLLIDKLKKDPAPPAKLPAETPAAPIATAPSIEAANGPAGGAGPARSVWDEMHGSVPPK